MSDDDFQAALADGYRERVIRLEERVASAKEALKEQKLEYERRLTELNRATSDRYLWIQIVGWLLTIGLVVWRVK